MPNVIDATGKVVREAQTPGDLRKRLQRQGAHDLPRRASANSRTRAPAPLRPRSATKSAAAAASRGSKRAPAARARVRSVRRSGARRRRVRPAAAQVRHRPQQEGTPRRVRRRARGPVPQRRRDGARRRRTSTLDQDRGVREAAVRQRQRRRRTARRTLVVLRPRRSRTATRSHRVGAQPAASVGVTHTGALDVKDVLRYKRLVFTAAAYDAIVERVRARRQK